MDRSSAYLLFSKHAVLPSGVVMLAAVFTEESVGSVVATTPVVYPVCSTPLAALAIAARDSRGGVNRDLFA